MWIKPGRSCTLSRQENTIFFLVHVDLENRSLFQPLKEIFSGNQALFQGLYIHDKIEWGAHPVIHLDFSLLQRDNANSLRAALLRKIREIAANYDITLDNESYSMAFAQLILKLSRTYQQKVVVLIDEYDKSIIDFVDNLDIAKQNRDVLKSFYETIKGSDQYIRFVLLTGAKFSRVSVFSGLNNLQDITLSSKFATLLGYIQEELELYFDEHIRQFCEEEGLERTVLLDDIRSWYNGYSWNAEDRVYNPFSVLNLFANRRFANYWFASGTPTFLTKLVRDVKIDVAEFEDKPVPEIAFDSYDLENMNVFSLLFQAGYLTIMQIEWRRTFWQYTLNYPNQEVKEAFGPMHCTNSMVMSSS